MNDDQRDPSRKRLAAQLDEAAQAIGPLWPLSTFIAVNPLWDLRHMPFHEAVAYAGRVLGIDGYPPVALFADAYANGRITDSDLRAVLGGHVTSSYGAGEKTQLEREYGSKTARVRTSAERYDDQFGTQIAATVDREVAKWCAAYVAGILPDAAAGGFYTAWRDVVAYDPASRSIAGQTGRKRLAELGADPEDAILTCFEILDVTDDERVLELARHLARMPGWAGHAKWRSRWAAPNHPGTALHMIDYLAVRLCYEAVLVGAAIDGDLGRHARNCHGNPRVSGRTIHASEVSEFHLGRSAKYRLPHDVETRLSLLEATDVKRVWLDAYEGHYRDWLLAALESHGVTRVQAPHARPAVQAVFCIDVRSEGLRRHLENSGPYETFGFAGFFGLPMRYRGWGSGETVDLCPALIRPSMEIAERPTNESRRAADRQLAGRQAISAAKGAFGVSKKGVLSPFVLAEASGLFAAPIALVKTLVPARYQSLRHWARRMATPPVATVIDFDPEKGSMDDEKQALFAETALTTMGLTSNLASVVLLCGHGSTTENNPHASSLDCGACGGNRGGPSARVAAAILNRQSIRYLLAERDIVIPRETVFVAGEHDTATDKVMLLDFDIVPPDHRDAVRALQSALDRAGAATAGERLSRLAGRGHYGRTAQPRDRAADWAQVRPEWGLARNAALIVAPRTVSAHVNLASRCFLHSYNAPNDPDGTALEAILTGPMIVAHWISAQYYFSTVDPDILSAGDKTAHNIVAGVGVVQGAGGDLLPGLPLQSLFDGERAYHEPLRLLVVVQAPLILVDAVVARNSMLRELFDGQWVHLAAREDESARWKIRRPDGTWERWTPAAASGSEGSAHG